MKTKAVRHPMRWVFWLLSAFFYFYEYFLRVQPSVIIPELMSSFGVTATAVGSLSAFYFYIYGPMQLPVGVMSDRFGARKLLAIAAAIAGLGSLLFSIAQTFQMAAAGRFFMGLGSSFGFVGLVYICSHWFKEKHRGILIGLGSSIGTLGAVVGEGPLREMVNLLGWRPVSLILSGLGFSLALLIALAARNAPKSMDIYDKKVKKDPPHLMKNLSIVCRNPCTWLVSLSSLFLYILTPGFGGLWGIPFVHATHGYSTQKAGLAVSMIFVGWAIGGPIVGRLSDRLKRKKILIVSGGLLGTVLMSGVIYLPNLSLLALYLLFLALGFISSTQLITYSYAIDANPEPTKGTAAAFTNFMTIVGAALIQPFVGFLLDQLWTGTMSGNIRVYGAEEYRLVMTCFPIFFLISAIFAIFLRKSEKIKIS